jgi:transcriptional regulator with XRE-family HTH domain
MIGERLREVMEKRGLNQRDIERQTGVPNTTISSLLLGKIKGINTETLAKICNGLGISPNYLLGWDDGNVLLWEFENIGISRDDLLELLAWVKKIKGAD